jgi:hypothetical protein
MCPDLMYLGVPSVLSGAGPIDGYESFKADDETVTFDATGKAITSQYAGELWFKTTMGNQPDVALTSPTGLKNGSILSGWTAAHKLSGKASYMVVMGENSKGTAYPTGEIKPLIVIRGLKGWDPRLDSTYPGGVGPCRLDNPATWVYLTNPLLWALKWSLGLWEGPTLKGAPAHNSVTDYQVGGIGAKLSGIDVAAFVACANIADANGWTVCAYPTTDDDKHAVLTSFLQAGGCIYASRAGKISCIQRAAPRTSVVTISAADTAGPIEIDTAANRVDRINTIRPRIMSENHRWQLTAITEVTAAAYRTEDKGTRPRGIDYAYVSNATQGAQLAALQIANTREGIAGVVPLKPHLQKIKPGDAFTIIEPGFVLDGLKCLCLTSDFDPKTKIVAVSFVSETDAKYPFALGQSQLPPVAPALTVPDYTVTPPQGGEWTLSSVLFSAGGTSVPALLFEGDVDNAMAQSVIFEFRPVGSTEWSGAGTEEPTVTRKEAGGGLLTSGTQYEGAVSYRIGARFSARLILGPVTAGTVTVPPAPAPITVPGVPAISLGTMIAADGTEITTLSGSWTVLGNATSYDVDIDDGVAIWTESSPVASIKNLRVATGRTYRIRIKAANRDGVRSPAWSVWSASVGADGDTTPPGLITAPSIIPLARRLVLGWTNPADADYSHLRMFRNISGAAPTLADLYAARVEGSTWTDTNVTAGVRYYYSAEPVDRSGNIGPQTYMGSSIPTFISTGGGDVLPTDPTLVTSVGTAALVAGQGTLATRNSVTAAMMPLLSSENDFTDEDFDSTLVTLASGASFDTSAETTATMGIKRSIKSPVGNGTLTPSQAQLNGLSTTNLIPVTPGQAVRFNVRSLVKAGFTGLLRSFRYFVGPTGTTIGGATIDTIVDRRSVAQASTQVYEAEAAPLLVPAGASHCYFVFFVDWSGSQANAGYALVGKPRLRRILDFAGLAGDAVRLGTGGNVRQSNGTTQVTDATAITSLGVAALVAGQGPLVTLAIPSYANDAAAIAAGRGPGFVYLNTTTGQQQTLPAGGGSGGAVGVKTATTPFTTSISTSYTQIATADVTGQVASRLEIEFEAGGGRVANVGDNVTGVIKVSECDSTGATVSQIVMEEAFAFNSTGLGISGGYSVDIVLPTQSKDTVRTGAVRYKVEAKRDLGSPNLNDGINASIIIRIFPKL